MMQGKPSMLAPELVFLDWDCATPVELFERLEGPLMAGGYVAEGWRAAISAREEAYPTGIAMPAASIAVPHIDPAYVRKPYIAIAKPVEPMVFRPMAGMGELVPARLVVNVGITANDNQVAILQNLMDIFTDAAAADDVLSQTTPEGMVHAFARHLDL